MNTPETVCPMCLGVGRLLDDEETCPRCNGTGRIPAQGSDPTPPSAGVWSDLPISRKADQIPPGVLKDSAGEGELDTIDTLTRDACSVGYYGPKSVYRKRLNAYIARRVLEELEDMTRHTSGGGDWRRYINQRIAAIKKESQQ